MHDIEPHYLWRDQYIASEDERSPFYGRVYDEFRFTNKIYNYFIHPQWDFFGSPTLYAKILFVDYQQEFAIIELIGEWNDCIQNDVMYLKQELADPLLREGIHKFIFICENVLNFHGSDDCYYEELHEEVSEKGGWICLINTLQHVSAEMQETQLQFYINFDPPFNDINWRRHKPKVLFEALEAMLEGKTRQLTY